MTISGRCELASGALQTPGRPGTRGTDSQLDDTDRNVGPDLPLGLLFKVYYVNLVS